MASWEAGETDNGVGTRWDQARTPPTVEARCQNRGRQAPTVRAAGVRCTRRGKGSVAGSRRRRPLVRSTADKSSALPLSPRTRFGRTQLRVRTPIPDPIILQLWGGSAVGGPRPASAPLSFWIYIFAGRCRTVSLSSHVSRSSQGDVGAASRPASACCEAPRGQWQVTEPAAALLSPVSRNGWLCCVGAGGCGAGRWGGLRAASNTSVPRHRALPHAHPSQRSSR